MISKKGSGPISEKVNLTTGGMHSRKSARNQQKGMTESGNDKKNSSEAINRQLNREKILRRKLIISERRRSSIERERSLLRNDLLALKTVCKRILIDVEAYSGRQFERVDGLMDQITKLESEVSITRRTTFFGFLGFQLKKASRPAVRLREKIGRRLTLVPLSDAQASDGTADCPVWTMAGDDPGFLLVWKSGRPLLPGRYIFSFNAPDGFDILRTPKIYVGTGNGFSETEAFELQPELGRRNKFIAHFHLPNGATELRFDPSQETGQLRMGNAKIRRLFSRTLYYLHLASRIVSQRRKNGASVYRMAKAGTKVLLKKGPKGLAAELRAVDSNFATLRGRALDPVLLDYEPRYVPISGNPPPNEMPIKVICFYLPQFHAIPENDEWWGEGFTEWTNVRAAKPQFQGHYQPHVPDTLGYYDLRDSKAQREQVEIAKLYGIGGFCFYFYWFAGKRLLEEPVKNYLSDDTLDLPFCLCWANENWTRRWDGLEREILIAQDHTDADDIEFIKYIAKYLQDSRYIRVGEKPLILVYRPGTLPSARDTAARWRNWCRKNGVGEIYLAYTQSFENIDPAEYGFDAAIEFPPNNSTPPTITHLVEPTVADFSSTVYDLSFFCERSRRYPVPSFPLFRSVCPAWDNTARRKRGGTVFANSTPSIFEEWVRNAVRDTMHRFARSDERLVFVNAWNEWAEGAHLEPDRRHGFAYIDALRRALITARSQRAVLLVTHDCHPHGAQLQVLAMSREFQKAGFSVAVLALGGGALQSDFENLANQFMNCESASSTDRTAFFDRVWATGTEVAISSTVVSGSAVPELKRLGFKIVSLIHEMPGVIREMRQESNARLVSEHSDKLVFPAELVKRRFETIVPLDESKLVVRPQGLLRKNPYKGRRDEAYRMVCDKHDLAPNAKLVISVGYADQRKGPDLFVEVAKRALDRDRDAVFLWIGNSDPNVMLPLESRIADEGLESRVLFTGFEPDPMVYFASAAAFALTSREDPFPNVVVEAADVSLPVVAFDGASGAQGFIEDNGGRIARAFDTSDFADQVIDLLNANETEERHPHISLRKYNLDLIYEAVEMPRVSVIVPNYNYAHHLERRLLSITNQSYPIYEIIVLDDASSDDSVDVINGILTDTPIDWRLIVNDENSGSVFRQWRRGLSESRGDVVWIAEADDYADSEFLEELANRFRDPEIVLAYCQSRQVDENGALLAQNYLDYTKEISNAWDADYVHSGEDEIARAMAVKNTIPNVSSALLRRATLMRAFDLLGRDLYRYRVAGDWLLYLQVLRQGKIFFNSSALNSHRRHSKSVTHSNQAERHLWEVAKVQKIARGISEISTSTELAAHNYLKHVASYLGLQDELIEKATSLK